MDVVSNLIHVKRFFKYTYEERVQLKQEGRPLPDISIVCEGTSRGKSYKRQFTRELYSKNDWICGCNKTNALFCFPCILFGGDKSWTHVGVTDLLHLTEKIKRHETAKNHLHNMLAYAVIGTVDINQQLDPTYWISIQNFNENVTKNRYVLSKIIDCIKSCGVFDLALRGHEETSTSDGTGVFRGSINFTAELNKIVAEHLKNSTVFTGSSKDIQDDLLDCMLEICREIISEEIQDSPFLAVMADDITDVTAKSQSVVVLRYVRNGEPYERFWTYLEHSNSDAESLTAGIFSVIDPILENSTSKLIAQSYHGVAVMSDGNNGVQARIKKKYPFAHFTHCYAHQPNLIMSKAASTSTQVRLFFGNLQEIPSFFNNSPQRSAVLNKIVLKKAPYTAPTCLDFNIKTVNVVFEHKESLIECMEEIENTFTDQAVCSAASSLRRIVSDPNITFWLTFFHHVMPHVDILFEELHKRIIDPSEIDQKLASFEENIFTIRKSIDEIINEACIYCGVSEIKPAKRRRHDNKFDHYTAAVEVCDTIINCAKDRFEFRNHLVAASLFYSDYFGQYYSSFPDDKLNITCSTYPNINKERLKIELTVIYGRPDCRNVKGVLPFLKFLIQNDLSRSFQETKNLLQILVTVPMTTTEAERSVSTLKCIKTFLQNSMVEDRLEALTMLSIERKVVNEARNFNESVIEKYATTKSGTIDLVYKK